MPKRGFAARVVCLCVGFLASISSVIKDGDCRWDLAKLPIDDRGRGTIQFEGSFWDMVKKCRSGRLPPLTPDVVAKKLDEMFFTNDSDVGKVAKLYKRFFDAVTSTTRELS